MSGVSYLANRQMNKHTQSKVEIGYFPCWWVIKTARHNLFKMFTKFHDPGTNPMLFRVTKDVYLGLKSCPRNVKHLEDFSSEVKSWESQ